MKLAGITPSLTLKKEKSTNTLIRDQVSKYLEKNFNL